MTSSHHSDPVNRHYFNHAGLRLSYLDNHQASDDIPVFMLHGFTASAKINWLDSGWIAALTALGRRVIALDARGHGKSDKPHNSAYYPANIMMEDSIALMRQLGFPQADYAGFSMGARMSAFAAIHYPNKVRKLLLGGMGINLKMGAGLPEPIADALLVDDPATIRSRHARRFRRLAEKCGNDLTALAHCILSERRQITADCLAKIRANTLILVGDQDDTGGSPYDLMPYIPDSQAIEIDNCSHFNALTHDVFRQAGIAFLQSSTKK